MKNVKKLPILLAACFSTVILAIVNSSFGPMLQPITDFYLNGDGASQGYPNSAMQAGCIAAVIILVFAGGRLRLKEKLALLAICASVMSVSLFLLGTSPSFTVFVCLFAVVGLAYGASDVTASALVADTYGEGSANMMCLLHGSHGAAGIAAPIAISAVLSGCGENWSLPYSLIALFVAAVLVYLLILTVCFFKKSGSAEETDTKTERTPFLKPDKRLVSIALPILFYGIYLVGMISYTERYEYALRGKEASAVTLSLLYLGLTLCRLLLPLLRIDNDAYLRFSPVISAVLLGAGVLSNNAVAYMILSSLSALVSGAFIPVAISSACRLMPDNTTGASTVMNLSMLVGNGISAPLIGAAFKYLGIRSGMLIPVLTLILSFAFSFLKMGDERKTER